MRVHRSEHGRRQSRHRRFRAIASRLLGVCALFCTAHGLASAASPGALARSIRGGPGARAPVDARLRECERKLREQRPEARRSAVKELLEIGTVEAWELLLPALDDPDGQVGDEVQVGLRTLDSAKVLKLVLGRDGLRSNEEWPRLRVAEAVGHMTLSLPIADLVRALDPRDVEVCRALLASLERLALAGRLGTERERVAKAVADCLSRRRDERVRAAAVSTLVAVDAEAAARRLESSWSDDSPLVRCARVAVSARLDTEGERSQLLRALADEAPGVRIQALEVLLPIADKHTLEAVVARLDLEPRERVTRRVVAWLRSATGMKYRSDARSWRHYAERLPADWRVSTHVEPAPPDDGERSRARLVGMPILSDRLVLLVDFSGSTWNQRVGTQSRKEVLDERVREALEALPRTARFNLVPYTREPIPWREEIEPAEPRAVKDALKFFEGCRQKGPGNVFDALLLAFADPHADTILLLTDGAPTGGRRWNLELMRELVAEENRYRNRTIDVLLVDSPRGLVRHWEAIAADSGGSCQAVSLRTAGEAEE